MFIWRMLSMMGAQAARAVTSMMQRALIVDLVALTGLRYAFVPAAARGTAPMATAGGMLSMLGHGRLMPTRLGVRPQPAHANKIDETNSHRGRGGPALRLSALRLSVALHRASWHT